MLFDCLFLLMQPLSTLCRSFQDIDTYTTGFPRGDGQGSSNIFRAVKHCLPGPVSMISGHDVLDRGEQLRCSFSCILDNV